MCYQCCGMMSPAMAPYLPGAGIKCGLRDGKPLDVPQDCPYPDACCRPPSMYCSPCYKQPRIPDSYAPRRCFLVPTSPMEACTTYMLSYQPSTGCRNIRAQARRPMSNLVPSCAPMECSTTMRMSYLPNQPLLTQAFRPCHHDLMGKGPFQTITTQRHDYVPKPIAIRQSFKPPAKFHCVEKPFENRTINRLSYLNNGYRPIAASYRPLAMYSRPTSRMESDTIHKLSFQPVCSPQPQRPPWSCKGQYQKPCQRLDSTTTYRASYLPPGIECNQYMDPCRYGNSKCCAAWCPPTCIATNPYQCMFPRAAC